MMPRRARRLKDDDAAAMQVFEALLAAILILTSILMFQLLDQPRFAHVEDVDRDSDLARDVLLVLSTDSVTAVETYGGPEGWIGAMVQEGDRDTVQAEVKERLDALIGPGYRATLRLETGVDTVDLLPNQPTPRAGGAAQSYILPIALAEDGANTPWWWDAAGAPDQTVLAGSEATATQATALGCLTAVTGPGGASTAPDGTSWLSVWNAAGTASPARVPSEILLGDWDLTTSCAGSQTWCVDVTGTCDRPVYGLQLVVWQGA